MFTIKNVLRSRDTPTDFTADLIHLFEGTSVTLQTRKQTVPTDRPGQKTVPETEMITEVVFVTPTGGLISISTGIVYVMNAAGKTVETFRLNGSEAL